MRREHGIPFITAFGSVLAALEHLGVRRVAYATPYNQQVTAQGKAHLEAHGLQVVSHGMLPGVSNIYDETAERAYQRARQVDSPEAPAVFQRRLGMPTRAVPDGSVRKLGQAGRVGT